MDKAADLAEQKAKLETEKAELEEQASQVLALAEQNKLLSAQLAAANQQLMQIQAAYQASTAPGAGPASTGRRPPGPTVLPVAEQLSEAEGKFRRRTKPWW